MTKTTTTQDATATETSTATAAAVAAQEGSLMHVDPNQIILETNVRTAPVITDEWVAELAANGVQTPVSGWLDDSGQVVVRFGQRRTLGARAAGLATIPVYVTSQSEATTERIFTQINENELRAGNTDADLAAAYQQLAFEGLNLTTIAKRLHKKRDEVTTGLAVAQNQQATAAVIDYQLTLDQAATLIEFEGNDEARDRLIQVATSSPGQFAHETQRQRDRIARAARKAEAIADLTGRGFTHITSSVYDDDKKQTLPLAELTRDGRPATEGDLIGLAGCCFRLDWNDQPVIYLSGWKDAGFTKARQTVTAPMTDEQKAERRELVANNKAWASAEIVRREWLATVVRKAKLPTDAGRFIAAGLTTFAGDVHRAMQDQSPLAHTLLGIEQKKTGYYPTDNIGAWVTAHPTKAQHATVAVVLGGIESGTSRNTWRSPDKNDAAYFRQLAAWGYTLSEVEQIVTDAHPQG
ncbi:ParB/RepB/Spo0J family partition protein [Leifsonia sp. NPDC102414]|uniref:ParB/RepB/Spo0J family partition protein n=1 Tax=Leifsonia sp. NPDC102414 TaxID=3364124 RepID=UPI003803E127